MTDIDECFKNMLCLFSCPAWRTCLWPGNFQSQASLGEPEIHAISPTQSQHLEGRDRTIIHVKSSSATQSLWDQPWFCKALA